MSKVVDIADQIYRELGSPTDLSIAAISFWLRKNIGTLNSYINETYSVGNSDLEISNIDGISIGEDEKDILKKMYLVYNYDKFIRDNLGAASFQTVIEVDSDGGRVKTVNKTEISKTYLQLRKETKIELDNLINAYKAAKFSPSQTVGNDNEEKVYTTNAYFNRT